MRKAKHAHASGSRGSVLIEAAIAVFMLACVASMTTGTVTSAARMSRWAAVESMADAAIDIEASVARKYPLVNATSISTSSYTLSPAVTSQATTLGTLYGNAVPGTLLYTRVDSANQPSGTVHRIIIGLTFQIGGRTYCKTREVVRYED